MIFWIKERNLMKKMKRGIAVLLAVLMLAAAAPTAMAVESAYLTRGEVADLLLNAADSYHPGIKRTDIIRGYADGTLHEDGAVTRAQALVMLQRAFGKLPTPVGDNARSGYTAENFKDVPAWAETELANVFQSGIVAGTTATTFSPNNRVTRHQMNLFIQRVYALEGTNLKDDFYATVNKTALDSSTILPGYSGTGTMMNLTIDVNQQVAELVREAAANPKTAGEQKISAFYHNIVNVDARNSAGITPIQPYLSAVNNAKTLGELMGANHTIYQNLGSSLLLSFGITIDAADSAHYILTFSGMSPALGAGGYANATDAQKTAYITYIQKMDELTGVSATQARKDAAAIWSCDAALATASLSEQELQDVDKTYNLFTMRQLQALFPHVDLQSIFEQTGLTQTDRIQVQDVNALKACAKLFDNGHLELLKAYCRIGLASGYGVYLSQNFTDAANQFNQDYAGISGSLSTEDVAAQYVQSLMSDYLGEAYVTRHFSSQAKQETEKMVKEILSVYRKRIQNLSWMSSATKAKAIAKLDTMTLRIGYPDTWQDTLKDANILPASQGGSFFVNMVAIIQSYRNRMIELQSTGVDRDAWALTPYTVNAMYDPSDNSINFPAGILQAPFFDVNASYEENLGSVGYVIAHEITHAFDNNGAKFDENGNAADWWTAEDYAAFQKLCTQVVKLYNGRETAPGITCDGALTLSENIADLGAMACITELEGQRAQPDYRTLYTAAAEIWCSSYPRAMRQYMAASDVHAPDKLRGSLVLQQFQQFYDAFDIQKGDGMWIAPAERVTIW
jgi:putative endopeptidase